MTHYPRIMSCLRDARQLMTLDEINAELYACGDDHMIEPIDDPMIACDFWDWADVVGIVDEFAPIDDMI